MKSFRTDRQLQKLLPPSTGPSCNQPFRALQPPAPAPGTSSRAAAPALGPSSGRDSPQARSPFFIAPVPGPSRPRDRSPVFIAPATPEILEAQRRQREKQEIAAIVAQEKAREKKRLKEMERTMTYMRWTLSREGGGTDSRFTFQPEPEDVMVPPLRFTQVKNSWLLVPPPLLPLTPLTEPPHLMESPSQRNPTQNFVQVRSKTNLA